MLGLQRFVRTFGALMFGGLPGVFVKNFKFRGDLHTPKHSVFGDLSDLYSISRATTFDTSTLQINKITDKVEADITEESFAAPDGVWAQGGI